MIRDMDLVRALLLWFERPEFNGRTFIAPDKPEDVGIVNHSLDEVDYHLILLMDEDLVKGCLMRAGATVGVSRLTWRGHELLADIRDPDIWVKTKERAKGLTSVGIALIWEIAKAEIRNKLGLP